MVHFYPSLCKLNQYYLSTGNDGHIVLVNQSMALILYLVTKWSQRLKYKGQNIMSCTL